MPPPVQLLKVGPLPAFDPRRQKAEEARLETERILAQQEEEVGCLLQPAALRCRQPRLH
jgi:hypothetical protein